MKVNQKLRGIFKLEIGKISAGPGLFFRRVNKKYKLYKIQNKRELEYINITKKKIKIKN